MNEHNDNKFNAYISKLSLSEKTHYSLWKATKRTKRPMLKTPIIKKDNGSEIFKKRKTHMQNFYTKYSNFMILTDKFHRQKCKTSRNRQSNTIMKLNTPLSKRRRRLLQKLKLKKGQVMMLLGIGSLKDYLRKPSDS